MNASPSAPDNSDREKPVFLTPPGGNTPPQSNNTLLIVLIGLGLVVLLILAMVVVLYLPGRGKEPQTVTVPRAAEPVLVENTVLPSTPEPGAQEAEQLLGEWLSQQARAEAENITAWAPEPYLALLRSAADADKLLQQQQFSAARTLYQQVSRELTQLLATKNDILEQAIDQGNQALDQENSTTARSSFTTALAIDPADSEARQGAKRADNLERVLSLYREALALEQKGDLKTSSRLLQEAVDLDREYIPARDALARVTEQVKQTQYRQAMGRALAALEQRNPGAAKTALAEAAHLRPNDQAVANASRRLAELSKSIQLQQLRQKAEKAVAGEHWDEALKIYTSSLSIDQQATFATIGKNEAVQRLQLDKSIRAILAAPKRLQDDGPLTEARQTLSRAQAVNNPGSVLSAQVTELSRLVTDASLKIEVTLRSDSMTSVEIYHVGRFQPFVEYRLSLRPGIYTVVGRCPGFRDVRKTLTVTPQQAEKQPVFTIRCEVPI